MAPVRSREYKHNRAICALDVIIHTDHIKSYLAKYDPQALAQAKEAYYAFDDAELDAAAEYMAERILPPTEGFSNG